MEQEEILQLLHEYMDCLTQREREAMCLRFGLEGNEPHPLEEVAAHFGVTRKRILQIEHKIIRRHIHAQRVKKIRDFYE